MCVETGGQYFRVAWIVETVKRVEVWTQHLKFPTILHLMFKLRHCR